MAELTGYGTRARRSPTDGPRVMAVDDFVVWLYRTERVDEEARGGLAEAAAPFLGAPSSLAAVERVGLLGCKVDGGVGAPPAWWAGRPVHPDAVIAHRAVERITDGYLLVLHGRRGRAPDWGQGCRVWRETEPVRVGGRGPAYCPVVADGSADMLAVMRAEWLAWRRALRRLYLWAAFTGALAEHRLVWASRRLAREPWRDTA